MAETAQNLRTRSTQVRNETTAGANDAQRIGQLFYDIIVKIWGLGFEIGEFENIATITESINVIKNDINSNLQQLNDFNDRMNFVDDEIKSLKSRVYTLEHPE